MGAVGVMGGNGHNYAPVDDMIGCRHLAATTAVAVLTETAVAVAVAVAVEVATAVARARVGV